MLRSLALFACLIATRTVAQPVRYRSLDSVTVSRRALTISVPLDTSRDAARRAGSASGTSVTLIHDIRQPSFWLRLRLTTPLNAATYASGLHPASCQTLTDAYSCGDSSTVELFNGRVVITVRDSAMLALLFASQPAEVSVLAEIRPPAMGRTLVRYAEPHVLPPSTEALAEYDLALGREGWSPWTRILTTATSGGDDPVWMQVGEQIAATVSEYQGRPVDEANWRSDFSASGWTSSDSSVVTFAASDQPDLSVTLVALRPGRSAIRVDGLRGPSDDLPRSTRVRTLTRNVVVTKRVARVEITPRPATIVAGSRFALTARAIAVDGGVIVGAPIAFYVIYDTPEKYGWDGKRFGLAADVDLSTPGHRRFIARFGKLADTLDVQVVPRDDERAAERQRRFRRHSPLTDPPASRVRFTS